LPARLKRPVELGGGESTPPTMARTPPVCWVHGEEGALAALVPVPLLHSLHAFFQSVECRFLEALVDGV